MGCRSLGGLVVLVYGLQKSWWGWLCSCMGCRSLGGVGCVSEWVAGVSVVLVVLVVAHGLLKDSTVVQVTFDPKGFRYMENQPNQREI